MTKFSIFLSLLLVTSLGVMAQNNFSPYSQMGIGDLEDGFYNRTTGLANTGIAYRSNRFLINNNPASFSGLTNQYFTMETSLRGTYMSYAGTPVNIASTDDKPSNIASPPSRSFSVNGYGRATATRAFRLIPGGFIQAVCLF